jgi:hypothetical protein
MWGASNACAIGPIPNVTARLNYTTPDPSIQAGMQALQTLFG